MQWLAKICVQRPVFASVIVLVLTVVGIFSYFGLGIDRFPKVDFPVVVVTTYVPGAAPEQVETDVSDKLESAVNTIAGIDELRSVSVEGVSQVIVMFALEKNIDVAADEVRQRVAAVTAELPPGIDPPTILKMDPDSTPILTLAVSGAGSVRDVTELADKSIKREIESLPGVGEVAIVGGRERQINVWLDPAMLEKYSIPAVLVERALRTQNLELPSGRVEQGGKQLTLRTLGRVDSVQELGELVVARRGSYAVRLSDLGRVEDGMAEAETVGYRGARPTVLLSIRKQSGTNTVAVVDGIKRRLSEIQTTLPKGYTLEVARDQSEFIRNSINAVKEHLVLGGFLAALVVFFFLLNVRSTVISALAIPASIVSTFALMKYAGFSLNALTMLALTLSVGIVIDDAIVVLENIYRHIEEKGTPPFQAAIDATKEIGLAVLATTLSLVAVFLPVAFMGGIVGRFMNSFGLTMAFAIMVSLLVSFVLTPMLSARWIRAKSMSERRGTTGSDPHGSKSSRVYGAIEGGYMWLLDKSLRHRWVVVLAAVMALASIPLLGAVANKNFLPDEDESQFQITVRAPEGTSLEATRLLTTRIAALAEKQPGVAYAVSTVGDDPQKTPNLALIYVKLVPHDRRGESQQQLVVRTRTAIERVPENANLRVAVSLVPMFSGGGQNFPIMLQLQGPELDTLERYSRSLLDTLKKTPGVVDADSSLVVGKPELRVHIDRKKAADLGVEVADVAGALRLLVGGYQVSTYNEKSEQYEVRVRALASGRASADDLRRIIVPSARFGTVTLDNVVRFDQGTGPSRIDRFNRKKTVTLMANMTPGGSQAAVLSAMDKAADDLHMGPGYALTPVGQSREFGRAARNFGLAFLLSFIFMYLVLAAQFESWLHPVTILLSLPLTVPFAIFSIILFGQSLNIFSMLGILVLFGIVKKNSILQIDHTIKLRAAGKDRATAIRQANRDRLRPILMTTIAFVAGMIPLVVSSGAGAGTNRATGFVIIGGQSLALLLTLIATPVAYSLFDDASVFLNRTYTRLTGRRALSEAPAPGGE
ncbi:MAG: efflux RND transporter permease subunit [Myxococcales bacterium]|nr:efflux RND transporter permease subunit [Myxococcales bacterium]MCB9580355.1 efflux RND transporter permease subunit [Polyangiaceae bacterium]